MAHFTDIIPDSLDLGEKPLKSTSIEHIKWYEYATQPDAWQNMEFSSATRISGCSPAGPT